MIAPHSRFALVVVGSFVLWLPALRLFLQGDLDPGAIGLRYLGALGLVAVAVTVLTGVAGGAGDPGRVLAEAVPAGHDAPVPARRAGDGVRAAPSEARAGGSPAADGHGHGAHGDQPAGDATP